MSSVKTCIIRRAAFVCLMLGTLGPGTLSAAPQGQPGLLAELQPGQWTVTPRGGGPARAICLGDPAQLVQLRHAGSACSRTLVERAAGRTTVQYICKGAGYGRTMIRVETAKLVQIDSQGVADGRPFQFEAEARRTGACR